MELTTDAQVIAFCILFGNVLKNSKFVNNNAISLIILFFGAGVSLILRGLEPQNLLIGIASAWISTGMYENQNGIRKFRNGGGNENGKG